MEVLDTYTSVLVVLIGALLLVSAGLGKKQLVWKRPKPVVESSSESAVVNVALTRTWSASSRLQLGRPSGGEDRRHDPDEDRRDHER